MTRRLAAGLRLAVASAGAVVVGAVAVRRSQEMSSRTFDLEVDAETAVVRDRVRAAGAESRRHAFVNALAAVEGAGLILDRHALSDADRDSVRNVLATGFDRLRQLVIAEEDGHDAEVRLAEVASRLAADARWCERIHLDVTPGAVACGSLEQTTEALRQLLDYVSRWAPNGPLTLRGQNDADSFVLWVDAELAPRQEWSDRAFLAVGRRRTNVDAMSLNVATRLIRGEGGELRIEDRVGGGRSFGLCLPLSPGPR